MGTPKTLIISDRLALTAKAAAVELSRAPRWMSQSAGTVPVLVLLGLDTTVPLFKTVIKPRANKEFLMHVELRNIAGIKPNPNNPRHNDLAVDTVAWIQDSGCRQPVVDEEGVIIVGHTRYKAAQKLGLRTAAPSAEEAHHRQRRVAI